MLIGPRSVFAIPGAQNGAKNAAATFLRRVRIRLDGHIFERFDYMPTHREGQQDVARGWINGFGVRAACDF